MTSYGICRRHARSGFWRRTHDLGGTDWDLLLPLDDATAIHLFDNGLLCIEDEAAAGTLHSGILVMRDGIEARLALSRPETAVARAAMPILDLSGERTPAPLSGLWAGKRPTY